MNILHAIILGLVQGLTEFIPVSSSGHLVLAQHFLGVDSFTLDVLLNFGTLMALIIFYRAKILDILHNIFIKGNLNLALKLLAATVPTFAAGLIFGGVISKYENRVIIAVVMLAVVGLLMVFYGSERPGKLTTDVNKTSWRSAAVIAVAQVFALIPGTSRSGTTILAGLQQRLSAPAAAEFSFMLAIPTILGASLKVLWSAEGSAYLHDHLGIVLVGNVVSFISGYIAIRFLLKLLGKTGLKPFGYYRLALAGLLAVLLLFKVI